MDGNGGMGLSLIVIVGHSLIPYVQHQSVFLSDAKGAQINATQRLFSRAPDGKPQTSEEFLATRVTWRASDFKFSPRQNIKKKHANLELHWIFFNWDSNLTSDFSNEILRMHVFPGLETANSLMVQCGRGFRRPSTQAVTMEGPQKWAKHEGRQVGPPPLPEAKPLVAVEYHVCYVCIYTFIYIYIYTYIYIHLHIYIYMHDLCRTVFPFLQWLTWVGINDAAEWNCSCRTICRIKLCVIQDQNPLARNSRLKELKQRVSVRSYEGHVPLLRLRDNGQFVTVQWFHDQLSHEKYHYPRPINYTDW